MHNFEKIFDIKNHSEFKKQCLDIYNFQYENNNELFMEKVNKARGNRAVTATGIVSVAQKIAISATTDATFHAIGFKPCGSGTISINKKKITPIKKPFFLYAGINFIN